MSNTGHKGITDMREWGESYFRIGVMWAGVNDQRFVKMGRFYQVSLRKAINLRNKMEREVGKPRTERVVRFDGPMAKRLKLSGGSDE